LHINNSIQIKRWFGDHRDYIDDCKNNPLIVYVVKPFEADTIEQATIIIKQELNER
jgi:hypothetical protein